MKRIIMVVVVLLPVLLAFTTERVMPDASLTGSGVDGNISVSGELKQWHKVTLDLAGPFSRETDISPNPFTDYCFEVIFEHESGQPVYRVPGYFAADGNSGGIIP